MRSGQNWKVVRHGNCVREDEKGIEVSEIKTEVQLINPGEPVQAARPRGGGEVSREEHGACEVQWSALFSPLL